MVRGHNCAKFAQRQMAEAAPLNAGGSADEDDDVLVLERARTPRRNYWARPLLLSRTLPVLTAFAHAPRCPAQPCQYAPLIIL